MNSISIVPVTTGGQMRSFVNFSLRLYRNCRYAVPELETDTMSILDRTKNPSLEFCDFQPFLAYDGSTVVGRVVAFINPVANDKWQVKSIRFGWIDFVEDYEVCRSLLDKVAAWGLERGMDCMVGPLGFTDFDREGALLQGYDRLGTMATIYNYPYYIDFYERYGMVKDTDWLEFRIKVPDELPDKYKKGLALIQERYGLEVKKCKSRSLLRKVVAPEIFNLLNTCYSDLYGFSQLNAKQIRCYIDAYIPFVDVDLLPLVYDREGNLVGAGLMMPSLAGAIASIHGRIFPFGWIRLFKALYLKHSDTIEFLLVAVDPQWHGKGINTLMLADLLPIFKRKGFKYCETNCNLEDNHKILNLWGSFEHENHKRRRAYRKDLKCI